MRDRTKYPLDYRPTSYWTTPSDVADFSSDNQPTEVEIACIALASVLSDVISVRAHWWGTRIAYRIEDEYGTGFLFKPKQSTQPLSFGELIALIDSATGHLDGAQGLTSAYRDYNLDGCDAAGPVALVTMTSAFYPELQAYYAAEAVEWLASVARGAESDDA